MAPLLLPVWSLVLGATLAAILLDLPRVTASKVTEFCPWETFKAKCGPNDVIIMEVAKYGRMQLGRCVRNDLGYVGCFTDVMGVADSLCSGRQECEISTPNPTFDMLKPCLEDLKSYFEAGYRCEPVITAATDRCRSAGNFIKVKATEGYLSNAVTKASGCGSVTAPWVIEALPGQRINITLLDFAVMSDQTRSYLGDTGCLRYATIIEEDPKRNKLVCGGEKREKFIYTSMGSRLEVRIHSSPFAEDSQPYFLLKFQVFGCADPELPDFATYKRSADVATIGCTGDSSETWQLECRGAEWIGTMGTCADGRSQHPGKYDFVLGNYKISSSLTIAVIIAISIAIGIVILLTGLFCMRRQKKANQRKRLARETELYRELAYSDYSKQMIDHERQVGRYHRDQSGRVPTNNEYASIRDWPLPPTPHEIPFDKNQTQNQHGGGNVVSGGYFRSRDNYPESIGSGSENIYQLPEVSDGSGEELPRYFELDPNNPNHGSKSGSKGAVSYPNTGPGVVMQSKEAHYSN